MTNWQDNKGIGHTVLDSDEFPVFEKRDLRPDLLDDKPISPPILPATNIESQVYIILKDEPKYRLLVSKYRLGLTPEVMQAAQGLGLTLQNTATEQNGRGYIGSINHEQALDLNSKLESFTLAPRYFIDFLRLLKNSAEKRVQIYDGDGHFVKPEESMQIYKEITEVRSPWRSEWLGAKFSKKGTFKKIMNITYDKINPDGTLQKVTEQLDDNTLMENKTPGIDLEQLVTNANSQGLPKANIGAGNLYYWCPADGRVAGFGADSGWAVLSCGGDAAGSGAELGVRRAILVRK